MQPSRQLWATLWSLVVGFFMIMLDATIVSVANPAIMRGLGLSGDYSGVVWVRRRTCSPTRCPCW